MEQITVRLYFIVGLLVGLIAKRDRKKERENITRDRITKGYVQESKEHEKSCCRIYDV